MIRKMEAADVKVCGAIYAESFPAEHWGVDWTAENAAEYLQDLFEQKHFVGYIYEEKGETLGCLFALCKRCGSSWELHINEMAVLPAAQGRGIGGQLLEAAKEYAGQHQLAGIVLYTNEHAPAAKFYEKNGFQRSPGTVCMYFQ